MRTHKMRLFVHHLLNSKRASATDAARRAGYRHPNRQGPRLMKHPEVRAAIDAGLQAAMSKPEVLARLSVHAEADLADLFLRCRKEEIIDGVKRRVVDWRAVKRLGLGGIIKSVTPTKYGDRVELHDTQAALVHLGRHHRLFTDRVDVTADFDVTKLTREQLTAIINGRPMPGLDGRALNGTAAD